MGVVRGMECDGAGTCVRDSDLGVIRKVLQALQAFGGEASVVGMCLDNVDNEANGHLCLCVAARHPLLDLTKMGLKFVEARGSAPDLQKLYHGLLGICNHRLECVPAMTMASEPPAR